MAVNNREGLCAGVRNGSRALWIAAVLLVMLVAGCSSDSSDAADSSRPSGVGPILFVERDRAEVGDSDDYVGEILIERSESSATACLHVVRTQPSGETYTLPSLLASGPEEAGEDYFIANGVRVESGDVVVGDGELGSADRPPELAEKYHQARESLLAACEPLDLQRRFDEVFDSVPIIFIEEVRSN